MESKIEREQRQDLVEQIEALYPPDSDWADNAETGKQDVLNALAAEWRSLPLAVLAHMASVQRQRDN